MADLMIGKTSTGAKLPVLVDNTGKLQIGGIQLDSLTVNTDQIEGKQDVTNALLTTQAADTALIKAEAIAIDAKLPSLSSGRIPVEVNNAESQVYNYTITGALAAGTVIIGPIDCSQFREVSVHVVSLGTGATGPVAQVSNDGTNWVAVFSTNTVGAAASSNLGSAGNLSSISLYSARNFRIISQGNQTAGTTTLAVYASQQTTPKASQSVTIAGTASTQISISNNLGFTTHHTLVSAASTNATSVKTSSANVGTLILTNTAATWAFFKLVNKSSAPTVGTDTAVINIGVAPNSTLDCSTSFAGLRMSTGLAYYVSGGASLTDNTALAAAGTFLVNMTYV
jgi:hypothetical protein